MEKKLIVKNNFMLHSSSFPQNKTASEFSEAVLFIISSF